MKNRFQLLVVLVLQMLKFSCWKNGLLNLSSVLAMLSINPSAIAEVSFGTWEQPIDDADRQKLQVNFVLSDGTHMAFHFICSVEAYDSLVRDLTILYFNNAKFIDTTGDIRNLYDLYLSPDPFDLDQAFNLANLTFRTESITLRYMTYTIANPEVEEDTEHWSSSLKTIMNPPQSLSDFDASESDTIEDEPAPLHIRTQEELKGEIFNRAVELGFTFVGIIDNEGQRLPVIYSVGMSQHGLSDVLCLGLPAESAPKMMEFVCSKMIDESHSIVPETGLIFEAPTGGLRCKVVPLVINAATARFFELAQEFATSKEKTLSTTQIVWSDENGLFEGDDGYNESLVGVQSLLLYAGIAAAAA